MCSGYGGLGVKKELARPRWRVETAIHSFIYSFSHLTDI